MNNKQMAMAFTVLLLLLGAWFFYLEHYVWPYHHDWFIPPPAATTTNASTTTTSTSPSTFASTEPSSNPSMSAGPASLRAVGDVATASSKILGTSSDALTLQVSPLGAGLDAVTIPKYNATSSKDPYQFQQPYAGHNDSHPLAARSVTINGQSVDVSNIPWKLEASTDTTATWGIDILNSDTPLAHVTKSYQINPVPTSNADNTSGGYEVSVSFGVKNLSPAPEKVVIDFDGPTMPPREIERSDDRQVVSGYDTGDKSVRFVHSYLQEFKPETADKDLTHDDKGNRFLWAGDSSVYFAGVVRPLDPSQISSVHAIVVNPNDAAPDRIVVIHMQASLPSVSAGATANVPMEVMFGPKDRSMLEGDYYGVYPRGYYQLLNSSSGLCGICALPWLVDRLVDLLSFFHFILRDWGLAIIALVVVVRAVLHPITKNSQVSMMRMQKMGPEMERLKKKYGDDKDAMAKAQMQMYKEMGISPFLGCLPMFLQMPIWYALYAALQNEIRLRQEPFLWGFTWIHDLASPDRLINFSHHTIYIPILGIPISALNILPILVGVMMFWQQISQTVPASTPEQSQQQKMMRWMSVVFSLFLYPTPSGLNLYILTSSSLGMIESKRIRAHIKQKQEEEKDKIIVDAKPTRQAKQLKKDDWDKEPPKKGWLARLQDKVEQLRNEADRQKKKKNGE